MKAKPHSLALPHWYVLVLAIGQQLDSRHRKQRVLTNISKCLKPLCLLVGFMFVQVRLLVGLCFGSRGSRVQISPSRQVKPQFRGLS